VIIGLFLFQTSGFQNCMARSCRHLFRAMKIYTNLNASVAGR